MAVAAVVRTHVVSPHEVVLLVERAGAWHPLVTLRGPDAELEAAEVRDALQAGAIVTGDQVPLPAVPERRREPALWFVALPASLRAPCEALAAAWGGSPAEALGRYLTADRALVDLAAQAARELRS
jgi:hypothetical protein